MKKESVRKCIACQEMFPKRDLLRIVRTPEGEIRTDETGKLNGRGAYVCSNPSCFENCVKKGRFERALKKKISEEELAVITGGYEEWIRKKKK